MTPVKSNSVFLTVLTKISCTSGIKNFCCQYLKNSFTWLQLQLRGYEKWLWNITFFESAKDTIYRRFSLRSLTSCGQKFSIFAFIVRLFAQHGLTLQRVIISFYVKFCIFIICNFISRRKDYTQWEIYYGGGAEKWIFPTNEFENTEHWEKGYWWVHMYVIKCIRKSRRHC